MHGFSRRIFKDGTSVSTAVARRTRLEPPNPEPWLWLGLALDVVIWVVVTFGTSVYDSLRLLGPLLQASTGLAVLLFGAIVYIRVYDYVNRKAEKRQLRQEYALSRVKDIYVPLWDETAALIESAERFEWADMRYGDAERQELWKRGFERMMKGPLRLFVDDKLRGLLSTFHSTLPVYNRAWSAARTDLYGQSRIAVREMTGQPEGDSPTSDLANLLMTTDRFVWGATDLGEDGVRNTHGRFREIFSRIPGMKPDNAESALDKLVARLRSLDSAEAMRQASRTSVAAGELAIKRLEQIVPDPTSVVLEFES